MARDKTFEWRMQGMSQAYEIGKAEGIEGIGRELKMRGITGMSIAVSSSQIRKQWDTVCKGVYTNMLVCALYALKKEFGFGEKRMKRLKETFDEAVKNVTNLDWMGEHYVTLEDYAIELNEECGLNLDAVMAAASQECFDEKQELVKRCRVDRVLEELRNADYEDAAVFLEKRIGG